MMIINYNNYSETNSDDDNKKKIMMIEKGIVTWVIIIGEIILEKKSKYRYVVKTFILKEIVPKIS